MGCLKPAYYKKYHLQRRPLRKIEDSNKICVIIRQAHHRALLYFGDRYYNSDVSIWLSVDPMSDERPNLTPYHYCSWNPVMRIDPDGMFDVEPDDPPTNNSNNNTNTSNEGVTPEAIVSSFNNEFLSLVEFYVDNGIIEKIEDMSKLAGKNLVGEEGLELEGLKAAISQVAVQYDYEESADEWVKKKVEMLLK